MRDFKEKFPEYKTLDKRPLGYVCNKDLMQLSFWIYNQF